jgi:hypothetical protein
MPGRAASLEYSRNERRRIAPSRSDWYVALFLTISALSGVIGVGGVAAVVLFWINPAWLEQPEQPPEWFVALGLMFYGAATALAYSAARLALRRLRPARPVLVPPAP